MNHVKKHNQPQSAKVPFRGFRGVLGIWGLFFILLFTSCNEDPECRISSYVRLRAGFHQMVTDIATGTASSQRATIDSVHVFFAGTGTRWLQTQGVHLQLNKLEDSSQFVFRFFETIADVVVPTQDVVSIFYTVHETYISFQCGLLHTFTIDSVVHTTRNFIDSIVIVSPEVNNVSNAENIKIYRHPR